MKIYARQCCNQVLKDTAENAKLSFDESCNILIIHDYDIEVNKQSILNTEIKTP